ncbi:hypothetical protein BDQ17DRAFT_1378514 [Cyathus striatus]|nr:hypothetical protein BDQ17DRAFT_1378514 [Cyathus striatus]
MCVCVPLKKLLLLLIVQLPVQRQSPGKIESLMDRCYFLLSCIKAIIAFGRAMYRKPDEYPCRDDNDYSAFQD